jgi:uncharacterized protein
MILTKLHRGRGKVILAMCDKEIIGKKFTEGSLELDLTGNFYKGDETKSEEIKKRLQCSDIVNVAGEKSVKFAVEEGIVDKENIITIQKIPHAQVLFLNE